MKRIGDILTRHKTAIAVRDDTVYRQVTIRTNYKGVVLRGSQSGTTIGTKNQWRVSAGQFILSRIDARNGAFGIVPRELEGAIVTNDFLAFDINEVEVEREFFNVFLQSPEFLEACIKASRGNTNRKRVDEDFFLNHRVNLPPIHEQQHLIQKFARARAALDSVHAELERQEALIAKLRQSILQEAVRGNLTAEWRAKNPNTEPAEKLLARIAVERQAWIANEKKKGNSEAQTIERKIDTQESSKTSIEPSALPNHWRWSTLLATNLLIVDCHNKTAPCSLSGVPLIRTTNVRNGRIHLNNTKFVNEPTYLRWSARCKPEPGDLIFTREAPVGEVGIIPEHAKVCLGQRTMLIRPIPKLVKPKFLLLAIQSPDFLERALRVKRGAMVGHLRVGDVETAKIPLPPLDEQHAIVERVEAMNALCQKLESEVAHARERAEALFAALLSELTKPPSSGHSA